jgi:hypothetical protein
MNCRSNRFPSPTIIRKKATNCLSGKPNKVTFFANPIFDFAKSVSFEESVAVGNPTDDVELKTETVDEVRPIIDEVIITENVIQTTLEQHQPATEEPEVASPPDPERNRQLRIIEDFIKREPMIQRPRMHTSEQADQEDLTRRMPINSGAPITEAFAQILARQGKSERAIDIYVKLMLKNPEKKVYFAEKIAALKNPRDQ